MVFSSHLFFFYFLPLTLLLYYAVPLRGKHTLLTGLSYLFYGWANPLFVVLMFASTVIDYLCGLMISDQLGDNWKKPVQQLEKGGPRSRKQRVAMIISICSNLSLLGFFKYFNFGVESYNGLLSAMGMEGMAIGTVIQITLPLGISFYTFQSMSYSIDVFRGDAKAIRNFTDFSCYVALFPQLVAGPIIRFQEVDDQLQNRTHTLEKFGRGVAFICMGLSKKILLANPCGKVADLVFNAGSATTLDAWWGVIAYSFQIYFDFSAYSDMAIGLGLMLGFVFPKNFDSPYISQSITEFWRRWHISLSTWLRDYLYIPLGGNRVGPLRNYVNLAIVMLLGGLWHGAAMTFIVWGAIHGFMLGFERWQGKDSWYRKWPKPVKIAFTYVIVLFTWVFFRSDGIDNALRYCATMLGGGWPQEGAALNAGIIYQPYYLLMVALSALIAFKGKQTWDFTRELNWPKTAFILGLFAVSLVVMTTQSFNPFIYFIF